MHWKLLKTFWNIKKRYDPVPTAPSSRPCISTYTILPSLYPHLHHDESDWETTEIVIVIVKQRWDESEEEGCSAGRGSLHLLVLALHLCINLFRDCLHLGCPIFIQHHWIHISISGLITLSAVVALATSSGYLVASCTSVNSPCYSLKSGSSLSGCWFITSSPWYSFNTFRLTID